MRDSKAPIRVLFSFPNKLGGDRICYIAWQQVNGLVAAGADVLVYPGVLSSPVPPGVKVKPTLARGKLRVSYKLVGTFRACAWHDRIVARRLKKLAGKIDIVHTWPLGAVETLKAAAKMGIPTVMERPNAHTAFAMEVVQKECDRLGVVLPPDHEHAYNAEKLRIEEEEYRLADRLLCPSDFVLKTFLDKGFPREKLVRHMYGADEKLFHPSTEPRDPKKGLTMIFVGGCAPRKGVHYALEAWLKSPASKDGTFLIAGAFVPGYAEKLAPMLSHPSVRVLGHRKDVPALMEKSDLFVLSSIEEGSALVTSEARASGCVPLVSEATGAVCKHLETGLIHKVGDVAMLAQHITMLYEDRELLAKLRAASLARINEVTWATAGVMLLDAYRETIAAHSAVAVR